MTRSCRVEWVREVGRRIMKSGMKDYPTSLSTPIDSTAARVVSKGTNYTVNRKESPLQVWDDPPPTLPVPYGTDSLIGQRHGRVTIVGYLGSWGKGSKWLARCACGKYAVRSGHSWRKNTKPDVDTCPDCNSIENRKRHYDKMRHFELTGKYPDEK